MATFSKIALSASTNGMAIPIPTYAGAGNPATLVHTAHATALDEIWLWVVAYSNTTVLCGVQWGQNVATKEIVVPITYSVPNPAQWNQALSGAYLIVPGLILSGGLTVRLYCSVGTSLVCYGYVNRIT